MKTSKPKLLIKKYLDSTQMNIKIKLNLNYHLTFANKQIKLACLFFLLTFFIQFNLNAQDVNGNHPDRKKDVINSLF